MAFVFEHNEWKLRQDNRVWSLNEFSRSRIRPFYLYDLSSVVERLEWFKRAPGRVHYAMKANANRRLLELMCRRGAGVDVVSLGELQRAVEVGFSPAQVIFSGVGKDREDIEYALSAGVLQINVESFEELQAIASLARQRRVRARVALRLNIHLTAPTHKHVQTATEESKFGLDQRLLPEVLAWIKANSEVDLTGLAVHIGSQILDTSIFGVMAQKIGEIYSHVRAQGFPLGRLDLGGGLGLDYHSAGGEDRERLQAYFDAIARHGTGAEVVLEPGRYLVARAGVLLAKVVYVKRGIERRFAVLNAGMNCLMRPALYGSYHRIEPVGRREGAPVSYTVAGPLCESTDIFAESRDLSPLEPDDWVAIFDTGAYGAVLANNYNLSRLPEEWTVLDDVWEVS